MIFAKPFLDSRAVYVIVDALTRYPDNNPDVDYALVFCLKNLYDTQKEISVLNFFCL